MSVAVVQHRSAPISDQVEAAIQAVVRVAELADDGRIKIPASVRQGLHDAVESLDERVRRSGHG